MRNPKTIIADTICRFARKKVVVLSENSGLGNRLKRLASFHVYHDLNDTVVFWNPHGWVSASFSDLFHLDGVQGFRSCRVNTRMAGYTYPSLGDGDGWRLKVDPDELDESFLIERNGRSFLSIDFRFNAIPDLVCQKYTSFFRRLRPSLVVQRRIDQVALNENVICVHVRNPVMASDAKMHCAEIDWFIARMREFPDHRKFFISTMGRKFSQPLHSEFQDRIVELPNKDHQSMYDAVADMYLLGMGEELIVSSGSTFSEVSWWLGGCSQHVVVAPPSAPSPRSLRHAGSFA